MREEIGAAVVFLTRLVKKNENLSEDQVEAFSKCLSGILEDRFQDHWYQDKPQKGQGYRCIRMNETVARDPVIEKAATDSGLDYTDLNMPPELTIWVDPSEVCCRFGENKGSWCTLFKEGKQDQRADTPVIERVLSQSKGNTTKKPIEVTRSNHRAGSSSPPSTHNGPRGSHYGTNSNMGVLRNFNHNHNNNLVKFNHKHFNQNKFRQPPPPLSSNPHSTSPTFSNGGRFVPSPPMKHSFKMHPHHQFQQRISSSRSDRFHWVRGADLVKA